MRTTKHSSEMNVLVGDSLVQSSSDGKCFHSLAGDLIRCRVGFPGLCKYSIWDAARRLGLVLLYALDWRQ